MKTPREFWDERREPDPEKAREAMEKLYDSPPNYESVLSFIAESKRRWDAILSEKDK